MYSLLALATLGSSIIPAIAAATPKSLQFGPSVDIAAQRAPAIFNSVYDSLRKWGSTIHPNGMSLFLATVPEGVLLHHGNDRNATPTTLDWLAYEIEHAEMFARAGRSGGGHHPGDKKPGDGKHPLDDILDMKELKRSHEEQVSLADTDGKPLDESEKNHGWLHTYQTTRPLHFLYVDGMSGNKGHGGVSDTQDFLLRGVRQEAEGAHPSQRESLRLKEDRPPGPQDEYQRVLEICDLLGDWDLEGMIRTEGPGFEIVKCDFSDGLEEVQVVQRADLHGGPPSGRPPNGRPPSGRPPSGRPPRGRPTDLIGNPPKGPRMHANRDLDASRTLLDYSSMVSAFFFPVSLDNPAGGGSNLPRLVNTTEEEMAAIREYLFRVIEQRRGLPIAQFNWQDIADLVVRRYASELSAMATGINSTEAVEQRIDFLLDVFIDYAVAEDVRESEASQRCSRFYLQSMPLETEADRLIYSAFEAVNNNICTTLFHVRRLIGGKDDNALLDIQDSIKSLMDYLAWSSFQSESESEPEFP
ncbi:hypothetical protein DV737_g5488, partial [Chaetothyriales sp. CBS 132003]